MLQGIIMFVSFLMCAVPFLIIGVSGKDNSMTPIPFWSGSENDLKKQLKDIKQYNLEMASLYRLCGVVFLVTGIVSFIHPVIGLIMFGCDCTVGIFLAYQNYKKVLDKYR